jgi:hypothetical protein
MVGCGKKKDAITQAAKKDAAVGVPAPSPEEVKAIAEAGFIYGLPLGKPAANADREKRDEARNTAVVQPGHAEKTRTAFAVRSNPRRAGG